MEKRVIDLSVLHGGQAKLSDVGRYVEEAKKEAGLGNEVVLTGAAPVWMYLVVAHSLHGVATKLIYTSPVTGEVVVFDHNPR